MPPSILLAFTLLAAPQKGPEMVTLPKTAGVWTRPDAPKHVTAKDIFDYMDGAGELYLGFRFRGLDVYEYASADQDTILVEIYSMESSDDAYGLLSGDWGGEAADLGSGKALYGAGLLRIWAGNVFARVMAYKESEASRQAVFALGRAIVAGRDAGAAPALVRALPAASAGFRIAPDRSMFLRSHLVLNSTYFLSSENLLDLGLRCEAAAATYSQADSKAKPARLLLVRYPDEKAAQAALRHFAKVYLPEKPVSGDRGTYAIEDGWMGFARSGRSLALVFECPGEAPARSFLTDSTHALETLEESQ